ncbi:RIP metalloprotease RseP [Pediococcus argentinicus]|uniref:Zinc metalloprotease n=1 Tax=Pediococcus argentinicus TaxID=480391 RepID=A0A0R2NN12_9LACO|nr:RIP metalloprotease RseP [Pediococcus argentinicus]KRO26226.1 rseP protein [Pediococcus argentinicus]NKZ21582.1 RIP metalloprotease RseP [Pediococcus argentinicus]GEP18619.1 zinc metalloprotease [Pediococcus argentinicus]
MVKTIITFIIVFGILVIVHEFGHFVMAKRAGILVREFSIGMGPKLVDLQRGGTTYTLRLLPVGGYVRMAGMDEQEDDLKTGQPITIITNEHGEVVTIDTTNNRNTNSGIPLEVTNFDLQDELFVEGFENGDEETTHRFSINHDANIIESNGTKVRIAPRDVQFQSATVLQRILTNVAGPVNNFILAIIVFAIIGVVQGAVPTNSNQIKVIPDGVARKAGLKNNDRILAVDEAKINNWGDLSKAISKNPGQKLDLTVQRHEQKKQIMLTPQTVKQGNRKVGMIGIESTTTSKFSDRLLYGFTGTWNMAKSLFGAIGQMFHGFSLNDLGGPVAIYATTSAAAKQGFISVLTVLGFLSLNLGIVNLFPIPALDGGKLLLNIIEAIRRKPIKPETENMITLVGFGLLMLLMILVTWNDIERYFIK